MKYNRNFNRISGQENLKTALLILAVSPSVNTLLISGEKGSGKSTAVRAFGNIRGQNIIEVPQNVTEDRLYGSIDLKTFLKSGEKTFEEGLLTDPSEGFLYFDEINLFDGDLLSAVLDFIETENVQIERDGFSLSQKIHKGVIGSMNPEEGQLRSGIVDKFAMYVPVEGLKNIESRIAVMRENIPGLGTEERPFEPVDYSALIEDARELLPYITVEDHHIALTDSLVAEARAVGLRGSFYLLETGKALAALDGRDRLKNEDLTSAARFVLPHRKNHRESSPPRSEENREHEKEESKQGNEESRGNDDNRPASVNTSPNREFERDSGAEDEKSIPESDSRPQLIRGDTIYQVRDYLHPREDRIYRKGTGKRTLSFTRMNKGKVIGSKRGRGDDIAILDTIKASILNGGFDRERKELKISEEDVRIRKRKKRTGAAILFVVDASGSMAAQKRMKETKDAVLSLLMDSYQKRDEVAMISFHREEAKILLPFTRSVLSAKRELQDLETGGKTPLSKALYVAGHFLDNKMRKDPEAVPVLILISDGRANVGGVFTDDPVDDAIIVSRFLAKQKIHTAVIDTEAGFIKLGLPKLIGEHLGAVYYKIDDLKREAIEEIVHENVEISLSNVEIMED